MENNKPATPATAATPGPSSTSAAAPATTPAPGNGEGGNNQEGKVTISTKEFAQLQRDAARGKSKARRDALGTNRTPQGGESNPEINSAIEEANERAEKAEKEALKIQVQGKVRELLDKDEYKNIPKSTRELILTNPHLLSNADNLDEAILDIEDFLIEKVLVFDTAPSPATTTTPPVNQPGGHETPPAIGSGAPAPASGTDLEDTSKLSGPAKTQAMIRNSMRKNKK